MSHIPLALMPHYYGNAELPQLKLPQLQLPTFDGSFEQWLHFKDAFLSSIHNNKSLSDVNRLQYLKSSLRGVAASTVQNLPSTAANYKLIWDTLVRRYENRKMIIDKHLKALFNLKRVEHQNATSLRAFLDDLTNQVQALEMLNEPSRDTLLIHLASQSLDNETKNNWEEYRVKSLRNTQEVKFDDFLLHIEGRCLVLDSLISESSQTKNKAVYQSKRISSAITAPQKCALCKDNNHFINQCPKYLAMTVPVRQKFIRDQKRCTNCLSANHATSNCASSNCRQCGMRHHTSLHVEAPRATSNIAHAKQGRVILTTAVVQCGSKTIRAFLDCGSQPNFMTMRIVNELQLEIRKYTTPVYAANQATLNVRGYVQATIKALISDFQIRTAFLVVDTIVSDLPCSDIDRDELQIPDDIRLADPAFHKTGPINMLIGQEYFWDVLKGDKIKLINITDSPYLYDSEFGWLVGGRLYRQGHQSSVRQLALVQNDLNKTLEQFWAIEEVSATRKKTTAEEFYEEHFARTHYRDSDGRFVVQLPLTSDPNNELGVSKAQALACFHKLDRRLQANPDLYQQYRTFIEEYIDLNHMKLVSRDETEQTPYYFPHHCVLKPDSTTTKLRVVFNGFAKSRSGKSLNDLMPSGPVLQQELLSIVLRFRKHEIVLTGDITKMYRQVRIDPCQTHLQRILWRSQPDQPIELFELLTVTYGTSAGMFLAVKALQQAALSKKDVFPEAAAILLRDMYVDDLLTGTDDRELSFKIKNDVKTILAAAGFDMRKWASNFRPILDELEGVPSNYQFRFDDNDDTIKPLGLEWSPTKDILQYSINILHSETITKRTILSSVARIFDPLGLVGPVIIVAKIVMQKLWKLKIEWDEALPTDIRKDWQRFEGELTQLDKLQIPRRFLRESKPFVLHGFCDASEVAYGACLYAVIPGVSSTLICAKSKVAPLKKVSLPRLELCGALLLARLVNKVALALECNVSTYLWTDSTIVLCWIKSPREWKAFVANRVGEIHHLTISDQWNHVSTAENPADLISQGCTVTELVDSQLWWSGPNFETLPEVKWSLDNQIDSDLIVEEERITTLVVTVPSNAILDDLIVKYSSLKRACQTLSQVLTFIYRLKQKAGIAQPEINHLRLSQIAESIFVINCQKQQFQHEYEALKKNTKLSSSSKLLQLNPFLDDKGIIRVGGRLHYSTLPYEQKHPAVLPAKSSFTNLVIQREHHTLLHAGANQTLSSLRQRYWVLSGRRTVKDTLKRCLTCFRFSARSIIPQMGDLPSDRVVPARPFSIAGVDYAGPFLLKHGGPRSKTLTKAYAAIFVCMATKAVHIELVSSLASDAYINTLRRFIARRGVVSKLWSDNATNFVGASNELKTLLLSPEVTSAIRELSIQFQFIPARSPHYGGLWESAVKATKRHLLRVIGESRLNFEQLTTLLAQIEAVLNSRPLCQLTEDPSDLNYLTPGHFLIGEPIITLPSIDLQAIAVNRLDHWPHVQQMHQQFWSRWQRDYLHNLQERVKWRVNGPGTLTIGQLVLLKEANLPPLQWKVGRVEHLHEGRDGVIRSVTLRTSHGTTTRAIINLCPFPIEN